MSLQKTDYLYYRYNPWWEGRFCLNGVMERPKLESQLLKSLDSRDIVLLTGLRRIGKTTAMRLLIKRLIGTHKVKANLIFYISLDDYSLKGKSLLEVVEDFYRLQRLTHDADVYLFLDEVTAVEDYEVQLKNLYDNGHAKIYAASSSASVLRQGKAQITGRKTTLEVMPLDFEEYLKFKNITIRYADSHLLPVYFEDYLRTGGIPEFVLTGNVDYLRELVDDIICKDIAAVHGIKQLDILKDFFLLLMERAGKAASINKLARILSIAPDTARRYLALFEDSYLIYSVSRYGKLNEQLRAPKKVYAADLGIRVLFTGFRDLGSLFENYVFQLIRKRQPRYVLQDKIEIDFLTDDKTLIEVKYGQELRPKQQALFDSFKATEKLQIKDIFDVQRCLSDSPEAVFVSEDAATYGSYREKPVNLGRSPGMTVE